MRLHIKLVLPNLNQEIDPEFWGRCVESNFESRSLNNVMINF
ncbi:hypothetical protein [Calothrix sp. NIES-3974]|nr:hypothetical protein [Calothrix sp. NIES-3974]